MVTIRINNKIVQLKNAVIKVSIFKRIRPALVDLIFFARQGNPLVLGRYAWCERCAVESRDVRGHRRNAIPDRGLVRHWPPGLPIARVARSGDGRGHPVGGGGLCLVHLRTLPLRRGRPDGSGTRMSESFQQHGDVIFNSRMLGNAFSSPQMIEIAHGRNVARKGAPGRWACMRTGDLRMNHYVEGTIVQQAMSSACSAEPVADDPISSAAAAVEQSLAMAHEAGKEDAVRLLHAVLGLLAAAPRH